MYALHAFRIGLFVFVILPACGRIGISEDHSMIFSSNYLFVESFPPCTDDRVMEFERELGSGLPEDYRSFLLQHNGALFKEAPAFPLLDADKADELSDKFGFVNLLWGLAPGSPSEPGWNERAKAAAKSPAWEDLRVARAGLEFQDRVPARIIAVGDNTLNDRLCISIAGEDKGRVYLWRPLVLWEEHPRPSMEFLHPVAESFADFWKSFVPFDVLEGEQ